MDKKTIKSPFGEIIQLENGTFQISEKQFMDLLENKYNLPEPKRAIKAVADAQMAFAKDAALFLGEQVCKTAEDARLVAGEGNGKVTVVVKAEDEVTIPAKKEGEAPSRETRYGTFSVQVQGKTPSSWKNDKELQDMHSKIEDSVRAARKKK